jgi:hypothetical protein
VKLWFPFPTPQKKMNKQINKFLKSRLREIASSIITRKRHSMSTELVNELNKK